MNMTTFNMKHGHVLKTDLCLKRHKKLAWSRVSVYMAGMYNVKTIAVSCQLKEVTLYYLTITLNVQNLRDAKLEGKFDIKYCKFRTNLNYVNLYGKLIFQILMGIVIR